jgi:hypothetical protein
MKKRLINLRGEKPLLDIAAYGRSGPRTLTQAEREHIARTVGKVPEVVVKVSGGARTLAGVERHMDYIGRKGKLGLESDTGEHLTGKRFEADLIRDWNLDLEAHRRQTARSIRFTHRPPKLVHNLIFSMPPGTPPDKLLKAVRRLAQEQFAFRHRYAMALHTDEPHPHVHVVVKAMSEQGDRLNIRKATLREWRRDFARYLRELGVAANATERAVRGGSRTRKTDGIFRAAERGVSTHMYQRTLDATHDIESGHVSFEPGKAKLVATRREVANGWRSVGELLAKEGQTELARQVRRFLDRMPPPQTERETIAERSPGRTPGIDKPHLTR